MREKGGIREERKLLLTAGIKNCLPARFATLASAIAARTAAAAAAKTTAPATAATLFARTRFVYVQRTAVHFLTVNCIHRFARFRRIGHFHKSKPAGLSGIAIANYADALDSAVLGKRGFKLSLGGLVGKISYEYIGHFLLKLLTLH